MMYNQGKIIIRETMMDDFEQYLEERENAPATVRKYTGDIRVFLRFMEENKEIDKLKLLKYKDWLIENYAITSANSMIAALNCFLDCIGAGKWKLRRFKIQCQCFRKEEREMTKDEYIRLKTAAEKSGKARLALLIETIAGTGIRISELKFFTAESVKKGRIQIRNKGKMRVILLPEKLRLKLLYFMRKNQIETGIIFRTRSGKPEDRSNIWKEMKRIGYAAGVDTKKVFPHNLRHLFATVFYNMTRDIVGLADLLGHSSIAATRLYARNGMTYYQKQLDSMTLILE